MGWRDRLTPSNMAICLLGVVTLALVVLAVEDRDTPRASGPLVASQQRSVAFIGDSFTSGTPEGGRGPTNYTALLGDRTGWRTTNASVDGSGYVAGRRFGSQIPQVVASAPELVVVVGARPDVTQDPEAVRVAAEQLYGDLRRQLPRVTILVVGPVWPGGDPPVEMLVVRDAVRDAAGAAGLSFVDPIAGRWLADGDGLTPDGEHLTDRGHQRLADLIGSVVRRGGVPFG